MAEPEQLMRNMAVADATVFGLVGERIYPVVLPQDVTYPAVRYARVSGMREYSHDGDSGLVDARSQWDCYAETWIDARALATALIGALSGKRLGDIQAIHLESQRDLYEDDVSSAAARVYRVSIDFRAWARQAVA